MPAPHRMKKRIPVTIVTGALGAGKTTAMGSLLARRPAGEHWAVLVNEFGALGIDAAILEGGAGGDGGEGGETGGYTVRELAGGCMCCALAGPLGGTIATLVRRTKPDRLLIEPSGLGHPAGLLDILMGEHLAPALEVRAIVCLVDPRALIGDGALRDSPIFQDQVHVADAVVGSKADVASPEALSAFAEWARDLFPAKACVATASRGEVPLDLLDLPRDPLRAPLFPDLYLEARDSAAPHGHDHSQAHGHGHGEDHDYDGGGAPALEPGKPHRVVAAGGGGRGACGWVFHPADVFERDGLSALLVALWPRAGRVKGVFRIGKAWVAPMLDADGGVGLAEIAYRRDSRIEIIAADGGAGGEEDGTAAAAAAAGRWDEVERALLALLK